MKVTLLYISWILIAVLAFYAGASHRQKVDLPEEYKLITPQTPIRGYYKNDTLHIEFVH